MESQEASKIPYILSQFVLGLKFAMPFWRTDI